MDTRVRKLVVNAIVDSWQKQREENLTVRKPVLKKVKDKTTYNVYDVFRSPIESRDLYERLIAAEEDIPDYAMKEILEGLYRSCLIVGVLGQNRDEVRVHGNMTITGASPYLWRMR